MIRPTFIRHSIFPKIFFGIFLVCFLSACVREDKEVCADMFLNVKVIDAEGNDITQTEVLQKIDVYLFNPNGFERIIGLDTTQNRFYFSYPQDTPWMVAAWGNLLPSKVHISSLQNNKNTSQTYVTLLPEADGYTPPAPEILYGNLVLEKPHSAMGEPVLTLRPQTAMVTVEVYNIDGSLSDFRSAPADTYHIEIVTPHNGLTFAGELTGSEARYKPLSRFSKGILETDPWMILHDKGIKIMVFKNGKEIKTVTADKEGNPLTAPAGKRLHVYLDMSFSQLKIQIQILPWNHTEQDTGIGF